MESDGVAPLLWALDLRRKSDGPGEGSVLVADARAAVQPAQRGASLASPEALQPIKGAKVAKGPGGKRKKKDDRARY